MKKEIPIVVDVESAYPLNIDDVLLNIETKSKEKEKDELEEYGRA